MADPKLVRLGEEKAEAVFAFLQQYIADVGIAPTTREIGEAVGTSPNQVGRYLRRLDEQGRIQLLPGVTRGIVLRKVRGRAKR